MTGALQSFGPGGSAAVVGALGGIGAALVEALLERSGFDTVWALSRGVTEHESAAGRLRRGRIDVGDEDTIRAAAEQVAGPLRLVVVATGLLHNDHLRPEKTYRALDAATLLESYRINAVGPALVAKHMLPRMAPAGRAVFAALSARVGSIGDNGLGGWHAYRASKAALNMILRNLAIETARRSPDTLCVGLHPGTVDTGLSRPFQAGVAADRLFAPATSANRLLDVIDGLRPEHTGRVLAWDGSLIPP